MRMRTIVHIALLACGVGITPGPAFSQQRLPPISETATANPTSTPRASTSVWSLNAAEVPLYLPPTAGERYAHRPPFNSAAEVASQTNGETPAASPSAQPAAVSTEMDERVRKLEDELARMRERLDEEAEEAEEEQEGPGEEYSGPDYAPLPAYVYESWYYDTTGVGARPIADYAPPGYAPRDQQEGPAVPEFQRILPPLPVPEGDRDSLVVQGMFPGSFLAPGTSTSVRLRGFVRLASLYDFDPIGSTDSFVTNTIPVPQQYGTNYNMSGRMSRFALETWTPTNFCDWNVHTLIEGDFFNGPPQAVGGGGNPFRLRHAFFDFGYFRFGQQNTTFMDAGNWPSLVDFQGPNSWTNQRQPSARVTLPLYHRWYWAASMERCFSDITTSGLGTPVQNVPDFASHLRFEGDLGHLQVSGLCRQIGYRPFGGPSEDLTALGLSGSFVFHPWAIVMGTNPLLDECPIGLTRSRVLLQCSGGPGVGRYMNDLAGQGLDAQVDPITGEFQLVDAFGWNASYEHWFNEHWLTNVTFSRVQVDNNLNQPGSTYDAAQYQAVSLWWIPVPRLALAIEYIWGERENLDGQAAGAQRLHGLAQYNF